MDIYVGLPGMCSAVLVLATLYGPRAVQLVAMLRHHVLTVILAALRALRALRAQRVLLKLEVGPMSGPATRRALFSVLPGVVLSMLQALETVSLVRRLQHSLSMWADRKEQLRLDSGQDRVDCHVLYEPQPDTDIRADIVFIHGLNGSVKRTWTQGQVDQQQVNEIRGHVLRAYQRLPADGKRVWEKLRRLSLATCKRRESLCQSHEDGPECNCDECPDGDHLPQDKQRSKCWPQDWLPRDCPGVRVVALGYTTDPYLWRPIWVRKPSRQTMSSRSKEMTEQLLAQGVGSRPIVWVAHSKGGLFVKQILVDASESCPELVTNTRSILFYSVPHHGSKLARISIPWLLGQSEEINEVRKDSPHIRHLHSKFLSLYEDGRLHADVVSFVETIPTPLFFAYLRIVDEDAADPGFGEFYSISANHRDICKPVTRKCILYRQLAKLINRIP